MTDKRIDYRSSGVDIKAGEDAVDNIKQMVRETYDRNVLGDLGSFGGLYRFDTSLYQAPVLVSSTDGVGTKLMVAVLAGRYDTVGQDLVNHCVNDILVQGALPLFFLDYIGLGKLDQAMVQEIIAGMVKACRENQCVLIGGEMAEMPGIYREKDFDLAGTIVGVVEQSSLLPAKRIRCGDILVGMPSTGLHTNGYSLARRIVFEHLKLDVDSYVTDLKATVGELLLAVHKSYLQEIKPHLHDRRLHGLAHITGGGIPGNLKRIIPDGLSALVHAMAHIEFNAINLAWDAVYRFRDLPEQFYSDWVKVAEEEAYHFRLLRARLNEIMAKHSGQSIERIERDTDRDNFLSGAEAVDYGLVDKVLTNRAEA